MSYRHQLGQVFFSGQMSMEPHVSALEMLRPSEHPHGAVALLSDDRCLDRLIYEIDAVMNGYTPTGFDASKLSFDECPPFTQETMVALRAVLRKHLV